MACPRAQPTCTLTVYFTAPSVAHICPQMGFLMAAVAVPRACACTYPHLGPLVVVFSAHPCPFMVAAAVAQACACPLWGLFMVAVAVVSQAHAMPHSFPRGPMPRAVQW